MSQCALLRVPEDVLCSQVIPDCRVLLLARTCKRMHAVLTARASPVHVTVRKKVLTDSRLAEEFTEGMNRVQALFRIRHFECMSFSNATRCVELKLCELEDLTFLHLRHLKMHHNQLRETHLMNLLYILKASHDLRTFEFTQQSLKARHVPALASAIGCFASLEVLNVENNFLVFDGLGTVLDAVQSSTLSTLKLSTNCCEDSGKTLKLCRVIYCNCNCLKIIDLSFMRLRNTAFEALGNAISTCKLLESLDLSRNHLHCGCLVQVLDSTSNCLNFHSFNWSGNRLGSAGTFLLANHIMNHDALKSSMRELKLRSCDVYNNMQLLTTALTLCTSLRALDISGNAVLAHEVSALFRHTRIRSLDISDNYISDFGMRALLPLAMENNTLHELHVDGNHLTRHCVKLLRKMKKIKGMKITVPKPSCLCTMCDRE
jgi:Ran GTPase-activating protein (RanGAP) involved in mRNA processing and transport